MGGVGRAPWRVEGASPASQTDPSAGEFLLNIFICIYMVSRNIAVQKEVYDVLTREKRTGESFTSVLRRLLEQREGLEEIVGTWGKTGVRADRAALRMLRATRSRLP